MKPKVGQQSPYALVEPGRPPRRISKRGRRPSWRPSRDLTWGIAFTLPFLALLVGFGIGPAIYALWLSFQKTSLGQPSEWGGLVNYSYVVHDIRFQSAVENIARFLAYWLPAAVLLTVLLSVMLYARRGRTGSVMRMIYFIPGAVVGSAAVLLWIYMLDSTVSPFGFLLEWLGFDSLTSITQPAQLPIIFAVMTIWMTTGFWIVVIYGALVNISPRVLEAARIDGCGTMRMLLYIQLPLIKRYLLFMLILCFAGGTQLYAEPSVLASATLSGGLSAWSLTQLAFLYAFETGNFGAASAISVLLLGVALAAAVLIVVRSDFLDTIR